MGVAPDRMSDNGSSYLSDTYGIQTSDNKMVLHRDDVEFDSKSQLIVHSAKQLHHSNSFSRDHIAILEAAQTYPCNIGVSTLGALFVCRV